MGNVFSYRVSDKEYIYGRVLLDVAKQYTRIVSPERQRNSISDFITMLGTTLPNDDEKYTIKQPYTE